MANLDGSIKYVNPTLRRMCGMAPDAQTHGLSFINHYPDALHKKLEQEVLPTVLETGQWTGELALADAHGTLIPTIENFFLISDENGASQCFASVVTDITEQKKTQAELEREGA